jgi:hypothetical protein
VTDDRRQRNERTAGPIGRFLSTIDAVGRGPRGHGNCLAIGQVRILEARFHPSSKSGRPVVSVGRVLFDGQRVRIQPVEVPPLSVRPFDARRLQEKLEFLVMSFARDACDGLLRLRSDFWSFVEVPVDDGPRAA